MKTLSAGQVEGILESLPAGTRYLGECFFSDDPEATLESVKRDWADRAWDIHNAIRNNALGVAKANREAVRKHKKEHL
jgi:hypothetical protein